MVDSLVARIAEASTTAVDGTWQRHIAASWANQALDGRRATGRWGTEDGFPVLYLGRPTESVVVEAYRHLIDPVEDAIASSIRPRVLTTCAVEVTDVLDLRLARNRILVGLDMPSLQSFTNDHDAYRRCQTVAATAHQLGLHGIVAPAATQLGETLAVFMDLIPDLERPVLISQQPWPQLPPDPRGTTRRILRVVSDDT